MPLGELWERKIGCGKLALNFKIYSKI